MSHLRLYWYLPFRNPFVRQIWEISFRSLSKHALFDVFIFVIDPCRRRRTMASVLVKCVLSRFIIIDWKNSFDSIIENIGLIFKEIICRQCVWLVKWPMKIMVRCNQYKSFPCAAVERRFSDNESIDWIQTAEKYLSARKCRDAHCVFSQWNQCVSITFDNDQYVLWGGENVCLSIIDSNV